MKIIRYLVSLAVVVLALKAVVTVSGGTVLGVIDLPSFIFIVCLPACLLYAAYSPGEIRLAFKSPFSAQGDVRELKSSADFFSDMQKYVSACAVFAVIVALIVLLCNLDDLQVVGPACAVMLCGAAYAVFLLAVLALPLKYAALKRIAELENQSESI